MISRLLHTRYRVDDLEKMAKFMTGVLGLKEISRHTSSRGSTLAFFKAPESEATIEICYYPASGPVKVQPDLTHIAFEVDDIEAFAKETAAKGYPFSDGPSGSGSGSRIGFIDGPEGYAFELLQKRK
jgi:lactoylglutathione lyase